MRSLMLLAGIALLAAITAVTWMDEGEVATLTTLDAAGRAVQTRLWVVDVEGGLFVRAPSARTGWLARLRGHPVGQLSRDGATTTVRVDPVEDPRLRRLVLHAMAAKYGVVDRMSGWLQDPAKAVAVRLVPDATASL